MDRAATTFSTEISMMEIFTKTSPADLVLTTTQTATSTVERYVQYVTVYSKAQPIFSFWFLFSFISVEHVLRPA